MKKIVSVFLSALILFTAACTFAETPLLGGWAVADSAEITEENQAVLLKALEGLVGVDYEPVAYLGSQLVAGTNHCFLCRATVVVPDAVPFYALVYVYEDLEGNAEITNIAELDIATLSIRADETAE